MIRLAAIDLKAGEVVQLVGGRPDEVRIRLPDAVTIAQTWVQSGFQALHVIDLDAALGSGDNIGTIEAIVAGVGVPVQVGGGVRDEARIERLLRCGAARIITGTRAVEDARWRDAMLERFPGRLMLAADTRDRVVLTRGWTAATDIELFGFLSARNDEPWAGLLVTDVSREGRMSGADEALFASAVRATRHPLHAAGGIRDEHDLAALERAGVAGAILGMALYTGAIPAPRPASEP